MAYVRNDRFGNPSMLKLAKPVVNRKTGQVVNAFKTYVEIRGQLYSIEITESKKADREGLWVKITQKQNRPQVTSGFGQNSGGRNQRGGF